LKINKLFKVAFLNNGYPTHKEFTVKLLYFYFS
jgi:hypothetical protein